jgi:hypothetical protein
MALVFFGSDPVMPDPGAIDRLQAVCERLSPMFLAERIVELTRADHRDTRG